MKKIVLLVIYLFLIQYIHSQNIINNSSFEEYTFTKNVNIDLVKGWNKLSPKYHYLHNLPYNYFYINTNLKKVSFKNQGEIEPNYDITPYNGNSAIRSNRTTVRNLFQTKFNKPLEKGKKYYFEIWYQIKINDTLKAKANNVLNLRLGMHLTNKDYTLPENQELLFDDKLLDGYISKFKVNIFPQLKIKTDTIVLNRWIKYSTVFTAYKDDSIGIIGNFKTLKNGFFLNYYFDNLKLIPYEQAFNTENLKTGDKLKLENVLFEYNKVVLKDESKITLDLLFNFLKENPKIQIQIQGHTDNVGDKEQNQILSENRAKAVMDYLIVKNISAERLSYIGYGSVLPIDTNSTELGKTNNRRVEIKILNK